MKFSTILSFFAVSDAYTMGRTGANAFLGTQFKSPMSYCSRFNTVTKINLCMAWYGKGFGR